METADLVAFTEEILNENIDFMCSGNSEQIGTTSQYSVYYWILAYKVYISAYSYFSELVYAVAGMVYFFKHFFSLKSE